MGRFGPLNQGFPWFIQISAYVFFAILVVWFMQMISIAYHTTGITNTEKSIFFSIGTVLFVLLIVFSSFRYIPTASYQFTGYNNNYYIGGRDSLTYLGFYNSAADYTLKEYLNEIPMEKMYAIIFWVSNRLDLGYDFVLCINYVLLFVCLIKYCKVFNLRSNYFLSLLSLMVTLLQSFNTLRWSTSLLFSIWVIDALLNNKTYKALLLSLLFSICIHTGSFALLVPVFGFLFSKKLARKKIAFFYFLIVLIGCSIIYLFPFEKYFIGNRLISHIYSGGTSPTGWILIYLLYVFNIFVVRQLYFDSRFRINLFYICLFLMPLCLLEIKISMMYRFSHFGHIAMYFGVVELLKVNKYIKYGLVFNCGICALLIINICVFLGNDITSSGVPYIWGISL